MRRQRRLVALSAILLFMAIPILSACGGTTPASTGVASTTGDARTQTSDSGQVTVNVTWPGIAAGPAFDVVLDTHSIDLDGYDLMKLALLRTDDGREVAPTGWDAPKGGHHRQGTLAFPKVGADGKPIFGPTTRSIELIVRDIGGVPERSLRWAL